MHINKKLILLTVIFFTFVAGQATAAAGSHLVRRGESLWTISQLYGVSLEELTSTNYLHNPNYIEAGQRLIIPGGTVHIVRPGESLWLIATRYNTTVDAIARENGISNVNYIETGTSLAIPDTPASLSSPVSRSGRNFSASELDLFARLVHSEAAGESYVGQVAVAASVLNRVSSPRYPNTLTAVIYQVVGGYYQYSPVLDGRINLSANESARRAVSDAVNGWDPSLGATGFYNPRKTSNIWVRQQPVNTVIGNHVFFR